MLTKQVSNPGVDAFYTDTLTGWLDDWLLTDRLTALWLTDLLDYGLVKVKWSRYRPGVAQRVGRGIALLFLDRGTRRWWVVSSTPQPHFTPGKDPVPILQEAGWAPGLVWTVGKSRPHRDSIPDRPARSQSLYRLSYPAHDYGLVDNHLNKRKNNLIDKTTQYTWTSEVGQTIQIISQTNDIVK